ncbi:snoRNA-binding rRNA-processing protein NOP14 [Aspergillus clavatus NRRL 1]|uniref:rRNA maturation protein (Nop14), putative n=1 Tax=Aspergillus clavatus (strain ATCC 1007 / CBS 513.65 / DSM 816 / NCTC 3887 / NRRL 1 / QM 1276 / 107) TaxID=344612 RepID=A1C3W1_ASPCL|nr:rRNA maturation protein (Nop14), putative [Aspergillus clavatus NRRL 1]EAW15101.1 rRNA maturation protein (Nop14), putative [Aspergillus clavatus NRRL 1]
MPPSQLKQLKASLRDSGVIRQQQSKKQKRQNAKTGAGAQNRLQRNAALQAIRDRFNPFEIKVASRSKFDVTTRDVGSKTTAARSRPGVTKSMGEEKRRQTLLREMERKNKVGGIVDRRFGEDDPTMTPEERAAERFARESQKKLRKESMFNLEEDEEDDFKLTHMGQSLSFGDGAIQDDFQDDVGGLEEEDQSDSESPRKRKRDMDEDEELEDYTYDDDEEGEDQPERKKSKNEVMKEVIAKSKFYKLERQKAKEEDDDLREELDKGLSDLFDMLRGVKAPAKPEPAKDDLEAMNPERAALLKGESKPDAEREYDQRLKQLTFDKRSQPTDRTKTEEEKAEEEALRLKALEEERLRRMRGEQLSDEEEDEEEDSESEEGSEDESIPDDAMAFGLQQPTAETSGRPELGVEDEDDFIIDDDLVETRSDVSLSFDESEGEEGSSEVESDESDEEEEDELINGFTLPQDKAGASAAEGTPQSNEELAYTYPCPSDHEAFLEIVRDVPMNDLPVVVQRIRALHHPRLHADNKMKLGRFAAILVQHVAYLAEQPEHPPFSILENIFRHVHSLAKSHPENVCMAYRSHLREMSTERPLGLRSGDLVILTGIATTFPTSDHFHAIVTPAHLCLARFLGQGAVDSLVEYATGAYAASLFLQYQTVSKRYMPEFMNYVLNALCNLSPEEPKSSLGLFPARGAQEALRLTPSKQLSLRKLQFWDMADAPSDQHAQEELKLSLVNTFVTLLYSASDLWANKSAFWEIFSPAQRVLRHVSKTCKGKLPLAVQDNLQATLDQLDSHLARARLARRPLLLHHHRPLAIKTAIPKFEETFNPDKHYDPNRERAELNRLKAEFKRERKGAMRELRKDANFVAREKLREKKERDAEYEKKYKRLVAEIQSEEGREANAYEKEKRKRQGKW